MSSLVVLCVAAAGLVAFAFSALSALVLRLGEQNLAQRSPAGQSRVLLAVALLPGFAMLAIMSAALAPMFGWIADHCGPFVEPHGHPHICQHHAGVFPSVPILVLASALMVRGAWTLGRLTWLGWSVRRLASKLRAASCRTNAGTARVLPLDEPQAFVLGVLRPELFISQGLLAPEHREHLDTVLAHEHAHVQRGDPGRRFLAAWGFAFHLPGVSRWIERALARAQEMAADELAASSVGSRTRVASALLHLARAQSQRPHAVALAFCAGDVELRVRALLDDRRRSAGPTPSMLAAFAISAALLVAMGATGVHHGLEVVLGALGG